MTEAQWRVNRQLHEEQNVRHKERRLAESLRAQILKNSSDMYDLFLPREYRTVGAPVPQERFRVEYPNEDDRTVCAVASAKLEQVVGRLYVRLLEPASVLDDKCGRVQAFLLPPT
jgi:hypothetical protein